ncbi:Probable aspartic protease At2g35615 [Linum grandiflorum]
MEAPRFIIISLLILLLSHITTTTPTTIILDLIHRDSPLSPLHTPNLTFSDRLQASFLRAISRQSRHVDFQTDLLPSGGEYMMNLSIGTPPFPILAIADTGSDLTWLQSKPCDQCYPQKGPIFDPSNSTTFRKLPCTTAPCNALDESARSCTDPTTCGYTYSYGDHSYTTGYLASDTVTVGNASVQIRNVAFGCGTRNGGNFDEQGSGIVGLGGGNLSFVSQLGDTIGKKFSYCLLPLENEISSQPSDSPATSRIVFGDNPVFSSSSTNGVVLATTPLVNKEPSTYYYLTIEAITVGRKKLLYSSSSKTTSYYSESKPVEEGNIIIDSGTTLTFLEEEFYGALEAALVEEIKMERVNDVKNSMFSLCFKSGKEEVELPLMKVHFRGGADVELKPVNTFVRAEEGLVCFTMLPTNDVGIYGNLAQMNFVVGYDLGKRTVSFLPADCSKH